MPEYEVMVVCEVYATYAIEADSVAEACREARESWSASDLYMDTATLSEVLVESPAGSRHFELPV